MAPKSGLYPMVPLSTLSVSICYFRVLHPGTPSLDSSVVLHQSNTLRSSWHYFTVLIYSTVWQCYVTKLLQGATLEYSIQSSTPWLYFVVVPHGSILKYYFMTVLQGNTLSVYCSIIWEYIYSDPILLKDNFQKKVNHDSDTKRM